MKCPLFLLAMLCLVVSSEAQFRLGANVDYAITTSPQSSVELSNFEPAEVIDLSYSSTASTLAYGISAYNDLGLIWLRGDLNFAKTTRNFTAQSVLTDFRRNTGIQNFTQTFTELQLPISSGIAHNNILVGCGPIFNYRLSKSNSLQSSNSFSESGRDLSAGFQFSLGYLLMNRVQINLKREYHFRDVAEDISYHGVPVETKQSPHRATLNLSVFL